MYSVQSIEYIRASLNRYFKENRGIDIIADKHFIQANTMFDGKNKSQKSR